MADDTETETPTTATPAATRRRAPRKVAATPATKAPRAATKKPPATASVPKPVTAAKSAATPTPKPRSTKRATPAAKRPAAKRTTAGKVADTGAKAIDKIGGKWGATAIAGGLAVVGAAATAALLSLRGSTPREPKRGAHAADGSDATKSFTAGIADENTIPDKI